MLILRQSTQIRNLFCYQNNSFSGNKYNGYRRIFALKTDKGRDNQIAHPIYLPPLSTSPDSVKTVGGSEDVILKIPGLAGFQMKVKANSVTFPDGSRVGTLVVSPVTADKLPMAPPAGGAQFGVPAWTVQPAGTRFDPPIEVTLPNASSQPAGDNLPIVQWDHDLGQYVAMGRATVSEDGSVLMTDSGSGITKAGWGGLCRYDPDKCATAKQPSISKLEIKVIGNGDSNAGGKVGEIWVGQNEPLAFISDDAAQNCSRDYTWNFGDGGNSKARNPFYSFSTSGEFNVTLKLKCKGDECINETERSTNRIVNVCEDAKNTPVTPAFIEVPPARTKGAATNAGHLGVAGVEKISVTDIGVSCENGNWFPTIKNIRGEFSKYINTNVPNIRSITSPNEADNLWFCEQAMSLSHIPLSSRYSGPEWVYWPAVEAHEGVHMNGMKSRFNSSFVSEYNDFLKNNARLPINEYSKDAAIAKFRQSGYLTDTGAEERFKQFEGNAGFLEDGLNQNGLAYVVDKQVSNSLVNGICRRANSSGWNLNNSCIVCNGK